MKIGDRVKISTDDFFDGMVGTIYGIDPGGTVLVTFADEDGTDGPWLFRAIEVGVID